MTQGSVGTAGYVRLYNNKAYNKDYYERNKLKIKRRKQRKQEAEERYLEFYKKQQAAGVH